MSRSQDLLLSLPPLLSERLQHQTDELRSSIIRTNYNVQFAQTASELAEFRNATAGFVDRMDIDTLSETFRRTVHFTTYDSYAPLIARLFEKPCKASTLVDLLAPGLPDYIVRSTSTSGGLPKYFPKYAIYFSKLKTAVTASFLITDPLHKRTKAYVASFFLEPMHVEDENGDPVKKMYMTVVSAMTGRAVWNLRPEDDMEKMGTFVLDHVAPYAAAFIRNWRSFLLIHALFAVGQKSLRCLVIPYTSTFVDMMRHLDVEFDLIVDCVANGTIPDLDGVDEVRQYLQMNIFPDPERAAELRSLGRPSSQPGWCSRAWPNMHSITMTASGSFATYAPLAQWFVGSNVEIHSRGYGCTEARLGSPYNSLNPNEYKLCTTTIIEFLDITKGDSISALVQLWEVELRKQYEIVLTTQDGLWRYRLGDIIEISGFDPTDGVPVIRFIERNNAALRLAPCTLTEKELGAAILAMTRSPNTSVQIVGWTTVVDHRCSPVTVGFLVELCSGQAVVSDLTHAIDRVLEKLLQSNKRLASSFKCESFRRPTIRLVPPGTFSAFLQMKADESCYGNFSQLKVPVVLSKAEHVTWFLNRVVKEL